MMSGFTPAGQRAMMWFFAGKLMCFIAACTIFFANSWTPLPAAAWIACIVVAVVVAVRGAKYEQQQGIYWDAESEDWKMAPDT